MRLLVIVVLLLTDIVIVGAIWIRVMRADAWRDEVEESLWIRSIEDYRSRAQRPRPHAVTFPGRIRRPLGAVPVSDQLSDQQA